MRPPCNANEIRLVQTIGRAVSKGIPDLNKTTNVNAHFFILFLGTSENSEMSCAKAQLKEEQGCTVTPLLPKLLHLSCSFDNQENECLRQSYSTKLRSIAWF